MKKAVIYGRVSTMDQSYDRQISELREHAANNNYKIIHEPFVEKISGLKNKSDRTQLNKLLSFCKNLSNDVDTVMVWELSRLSRRVIDTKQIIDELNEIGINVYIKKDGLNTLDENKKINQNTALIITLLCGLAENEISTLTQRIRSGLRSSALKGIRFSGKYLPYGYRVNDENKLIVCDIEKKVIETIFTLYTQGNGSTKISDYLNSNNTKTRFNIVGDSINFDGKVKSAEEFEWVDGSVYRILRNPIYKGYRRFKDEYIHHPHLKIIEPSVFDHVQTLLTLNYSRLGNNTKHEFLLRTGIVKCGICDRNYHTHKRSSGRDNSYKCLSIRVKPKCGNTSIGIPKLNSGIWYIIRRTRRFKELVNKSLSEDNLKKQLEQEKIELDRILKNSSSLKNEELMLVRRNLKGDISEDIYSQLYDELNKKRSKIERVITKQKSLINELDIAYIKKNDVNDFIQNIKASNNLIKEYVNTVVKKVIIYPLDDDRIKLSRNKQDINIYVELYFNHTEEYIPFIISRRSSHIILLDPLDYNHSTKKLMPDVSMKKIKSIKHITYIPNF